MSRLPRLKARQIIKALERADFHVVRVKGSHHVLQHKDGRSTVVPVHAGEIIGVGLLSKILSDCEMTKKDFLELF